MNCAPQGSSAGGVLANVRTMVAKDQGQQPLSFAVVRRGFDSEQVTTHLAELDARMKILSADRDAAVEQAAELGRELNEARSGLDEAAAKIAQLEQELQVMAGPPDTVGRMNERMQVMRRLAQHEFRGIQAAAAEHTTSYVADIISRIRNQAETPAVTGERSLVAERPGTVAVAPAAERSASENGSAPRTHDTGDEVGRLRREAAKERARLDETAVAARAAADEDFRKALIVRCREAVAQVAAFQDEGLRTAQRMIQHADEHTKTALAEADEWAQRTVAKARREVDQLNALRDRLARQLDASRTILTGASAARAAAAAPQSAATPEQVSLPAGASDATPAARADADHHGAQPATSQPMQQEHLPPAADARPVDARHAAPAHPAQSPQIRAGSTDPSQVQAPPADPQQGHTIPAHVGQSRTPPADEQPAHTDTARSDPARVDATPTPQPPPTQIPATQMPAHTTPADPAPVASMAPVTAAQFAPVFPMAAAPMAAPPITAPPGTPPAPAAPVDAAAATAPIATAHTPAASEPSQQPHANSFLAPQAEHTVPDGQAVQQHWFGAPSSVVVTDSENGGEHAEAIIPSPSAIPPEERTSSVVPPRYS